MSTDALAPAPFAATKFFVFDAYGTLFDFASAARRCADRLGAQADALTQLWRTKQVEYTWLRSLMGRHADFWQVTGEALDNAMATLGIADVALRARLMELYLALDPFPDARAMLERLQEDGRHTAILSNGTPTMLHRAVEAAGFAGLFDDVLSVEEAGIFKPHPASYRVVTTLFGCQPSDVAFISANSWDSCGAATFGFRSIWVNRTGGPKEAVPGTSERTIHALAELPPLAGLA
jgi:2-haloacid dehalogenase